MSDDSAIEAHRAWRRCKTHFRPEFLNRIDEIVIFHRAQPRAAQRHRRDPARRPAQAARGARHHARRHRPRRRPRSPSEGYDPQFGARPLKRAIQHASRTASPARSSQARSATATASASTTTARASCSRESERSPLGRLPLVRPRALGRALAPAGARLGVSEDASEPSPLRQPSREGRGAGPAGARAVRVRGRHHWK